MRHLGQKATRHTSLQMIITIYFTVGMILLLIIVSAGVITRVSTLLEENSMERTQQTVNQGNASLSIYVNDMLETMDYFASLVSQSSDIESPDLIRNIISLKSSRKDVATMAVFDRQGKMLLGTGGEQSMPAEDIRSLNWFQKPFNATTSVVFFSSPYVQNIFAGQYAWVITLSRTVVYIRDGQKEQGMLMADYYFTGITSLCENISLGKSGYVYLVDTDTQIVYHPQQQLIYAGLKEENLSAVKDQIFGRCRDVFEGRERLLTITTVDFTRWRMVGVAYLDEIMTIVPELLRIMMSILIAGLFLSMAVAILSGSYVSKPLRNLEQAMAKVEAGNLNMTINEQGFAEIHSLSRAFKHMLARIRLLMEQIVYEQETKRLHELNALQAQINPHFLYNTLDSIVWMEERGRSREAITMVTALARLFRISISKGMRTITVREELEHVRNYLIIQDMRFQNKFKYSITAEEEVLSLRTLKLIVQPIVENAIQHGLEEYMVDKGHVAISAYIQDEALIFKIEDNGAGMAVEQLASILTAPAGKSGIGVRNVHERIQLTFGKAYGIRIDSVEDEGTQVYLRLPLIREDAL